MAGLRGCKISARDLSPKAVQILLALTPKLTILFPTNHHVLHYGSSHFESLPAADYTVLRPLVSLSLLPFCFFPSNPPEYRTRTPVAVPTLLSRRA